MSKPSLNDPALADPRLKSPNALTAASRLRAWRQDPAAFIRQVFQVETEPWQAHVLADIARRPRVAIRSGHGVGKSALLAWVTLWWLTTHRPAKVAITAPTRHQLEDVLWSELRRWHRRMPPALGQEFTIRSDRVELVGSAGESLAVARTARKEQPEAFQGFHSPHMLFLVDEASGVDDAIFEAGQGAMSTAGAKTVLAGNPTRSSGAFFDAFHGEAARWACHQVACAASSLVGADYAETVAARYGIDSNVYRVRVLGEFPRADDDTVIPIDLIEAARARPADAGRDAVVWGVDIARFGEDANALAIRRGTAVADPVETWRGVDLMQTAGRLAARYRDTRAEDRPRRILIDVVGLGAGVYDRLAEQGLPVVPVNVARTAAQPERFERLRDELWWRVREWLETGAASLPDDPDLAGELASPRYGFGSSGRLAVETKDAMKSRGRASPDRADALCLTFADGSAVRSREPPAARHSMKGFL